MLMGRTLRTVAHSLTRSPAHSLTRSLAPLCFPLALVSDVSDKTDRFRALGRTRKNLDEVLQRIIYTKHCHVIAIERPNPKVFALPKSNTCIQNVDQTIDTILIHTESSELGGHVFSQSMT